jgi:hypothetical protein
MPTTLYLLAYDSDGGNREDWNVLYTPFELFKTEEDRQKRMDHLKSLSDWDEQEMEFHTEELTILEGNEITTTDPGW